MSRVNSSKEKGFMVYSRRSMCNYNTNGPWTKAGGVQPSDWPEWMKNFKDY